MVRSPTSRRLDAVLAVQKEALEAIVRGEELSGALGHLVSWIEANSDTEVAGSILLLDDEGRLRHCVAPKLPEAYTAAIDGTPIGPSVGSCGTAAHRREPVVVTDIATDPLWADFRDVALAHGLRACWSTPIVGGDGEVLGTFAMYSGEPRSPSTGDGELVELCVRTAAVAITRARAELLERRTQERLRLALAAGRLGAWEWDIATETVAWDPGLEAIYGLQPGEFTGAADDYRRRIHPDDLAHARTVVEEARAAVRPYEVEHRIVHPDGTVRWTHGWAAPRVGPDGVLLGYTGVVADVTARREADEERERILASESAARADAEAARDRLAITTRTLQRSLLPPVPPQIPGVEVATCYRPALDGLEVGGDFYDLPPLDRTTWGLLLGDVCGKGAEAAALTALMRYAGRTAAIHETSPAAVLRTVNGVLRRDQEDDARFATMIFARLRPTDGGLEVTVASGGHPLPLVLRADGRVEELGRPGHLLGVFERIDVTDASTTLGPGDSLIALTDGVLEARNPRGEQLADYLHDVLARVVGEPAIVIVSTIEEAVLDWHPGPPRDDLAAVVVRVPDAPEG